MSNIDNVTLVPGPTLIIDNIAFQDCLLEVRDGRLWVIGMIRAKDLPPVQQIGRDHGEPSTIDVYDHQGNPVLLNKQVKITPTQIIQGMDLYVSQPIEMT